MALSTVCTCKRRCIAGARLNKARNLLDTTTAPLTVVARRSGYRTAEAMRYAFSRELDVTPGEYRQRFG